MREALKQAKIAFEEDEVPIGAVVVCNNRIIARGYNKVEKLQDATAHAEMIAMTAASSHIGSKYLDECSLYVTIEPCIMCACAMSWTRLNKIVFGAREEKCGYSHKAPNALHPKTELVSGVLEY